MDMIVTIDHFKYAYQLFLFAMEIISRYPRPDPDYQQCFEAQLLSAKGMMRPFELVWEIFNNFTKDDTVLYHKCHNFILRSCIGSPPNFEPNLEAIELLEKALEFRKSQGRPWEHLNHFKNRITNCEYPESRSAFQEITIMYKIALAVGSDNIECDAAIPENGRNSDVRVSLNGGKKIYLEISSVNRSKTESKLQEIFDDASQYLYDKIPNEGHQLSMMYVDTTKLAHDADGNIDTQQSMLSMHEIIDQICINQISNMPSTILTPDHQHFAVINMRRIRGQSSVDIQSNNMYYSPPTNVDPVAYSHEKASLHAIQRKIQYKVRNRQYESGHPTILVIYWDPSTRDYESNTEDFFYIMNKIVDYLKPYPELSGVFLFYSYDHTNGIFISNPEASAAIKLLKSEVNLLFGSCNHSL